MKRLVSRAILAIAVAGCGNAFKATGTLDGDTDTVTDEVDGTVGCTTDGDCDDGNDCNGAETCEGGTCEAGTPLSDGAACETEGVDGTCQEEICVPITCGDGDVDAGEECDDANEVGGDGCEDTCRYSCHEASECGDGNVCTDDSCGEGGTGRMCLFEDNEAPCEDGNECTDGDTCSGGVCEPGPNACECETTGDCSEHEDGNLCNGTLVCDTESGTCVVDPETVVTCPPTSTLCHVLVCVPETGLCEDDNPVAGTACESDSNACTEDECDGDGACVHEAIACFDGNVCTDDSCNTSSGCVFANNTRECDDGNACTDGESCSGGACTGGVGVVCADLNVCTDDSCDPTSGCVFTNNTAPCNDGDSCTYPDVCSGGACRGTPLPLWYHDGDSDGYGDPFHSVCAGTAPSGYVGNDDDCCDSRVDVSPAQTSYFAVSYLCGGITAVFDYNCDRVEERRWTTIGSCILDSSTGACITTQGWVAGSGSGPPGCGVRGTWLSACMMGPGVCAEGAVMDRVQECR